MSPNNPDCIENIKSIYRMIKIQHIDFVHTNIDDTF